MAASESRAWTGSSASRGEPAFGGAPFPGSPPSRARPPAPWLAVRTEATPSKRKVLSLPTAVARDFFKEQSNHHFPCHPSLPKVPRTKAGTSDAYQAPCQADSHPRPVGSPAAALGPRRQDPGTLRPFSGPGPVHLAHVGAYKAPLPGLGAASTGRLGGRRNQPERGAWTGQGPGLGDTRRWRFRRRGRTAGPPTRASRAAAFAVWGP